MTINETDFKQVKLVPHLHPQLRLYRRLFLATIDREEAKATAEELIERRIPLPRKNIPSGLLMALTTALVVSYSRPFINSRGKSDIAEKSVPAMLLKVLTSKERRIHDQILNICNKEVAHSDADILEISIKLSEYGHIAICRNIRAPFLQSELKLILKIIEKLDKSFELQCEKLRKELPLEVWL